MPERTIRSQTVYAGRLLGLRVDEVELASGARASREIVEHPGAVAILAWDGERLAVVRQWRQAAGMDMTEIPAGTIDLGEAPLETARRELAEECGLAATGWQAGPVFFTAPGFCTEQLSVFLATGLSPDTASSPEDEELVSSWLTLDEALAAVTDGTIRDAKSLVGILWLARRVGAVVEG